MTSPSPPFLSNEPLLSSLSPPPNGGTSSRGGGERNVISGNPFSLHCKFFLSFSPSLLVVKGENSLSLPVSGPSFSFPFFLQILRRTNRKRHSRRRQHFLFLGTGFPPPFPPLFSGSRSRWNKINGLPLVPPTPPSFLLASGNFLPSFPLPGRGNIIAVKVGGGRRLFFVSFPPPSLSMSPSSPFPSISRRRGFN